MGNTAAECVVACCGLCCSNCGIFQKGKCQGCHSERPMHRNCQIKACVKENGFSTCAECSSFSDFKRCSKLHNLISRFFGFVFHSDRIGNLNWIRANGLEAFKQARSLDGGK